MPIFDYKCLECDVEFEFLVRPNSPEPSCPECDSRNLNKLIAAPAVSSDATRERARRSGLARNKKIGKEKAHAEHEYFHKEMDGH
jgi:putative FmdB family regulatory protein